MVKIRGARVAVKLLARRFSKHGTLWDQILYSACNWAPHFGDKDLLSLVEYGLSGRYCAYQTTI